MLSVISQQLLETGVTVFHRILPKNFLESFPLNPPAHFQQIRGNRIILDANRPTETHNPKNLQASMTLNTRGKETIQRL